MNRLRHFEGWLTNGPYRYQVYRLAYRPIYVQLLDLTFRHEALLPVFDYLVDQITLRDMICHVLMDLGIWLEYSEDRAGNVRQRWLVSRLGNELFALGLIPPRWLRDE